MIQSIVTDELSGDPVTAFEIGLEWGISHFELRGVQSQRIPRLTAHETKRLVNAVDDFGIKITAISPGLFKFPFPDREPIRSNLGWMDNANFQSWEAIRHKLSDHRNNLLPEALEFAGAMGAQYLVAFSFERNGHPGGEAPAGIIEVLEEAAQQAKMAGIELLVENEEGHWADTGDRSAALMKRIGHTAIGINWDPANALIEGDVPFPNGYEAVRTYVRNVHFKDARRHSNGTWEILHLGDVDWDGQIAALANDGYCGAIAIEAHLSPSVESTRRGLRRLRECLAKAEAAKSE